METVNYQLNYSKINPRIMDYRVRRKKAKKILAVLEDYLKKNFLRKAICLDIGCSIGATGDIIGPEVKKFIGVDIDKEAIKLAKKNNHLANVKFELGNATNLKFHDNAFDIIICNQVYEHVPNKEQLFSEIYRVLKNSGICYLGATNRLTLIEPHAKLPFLSWLPKKIANIYIKAAGKGEFYYENLCSYWGLKRVLKNFKIEDYTIKVIKNPRRFFAEDVIKKDSFFQKLPDFVLKSGSSLFPGWIWILKRVNKMPL